MKPKQPANTDRPAVVGYVYADDAKRSQRAALKAAGCTKIHADQVDAKERPERARAIEAVRAGELLIVARLGVLARSLVELVTLVEQMAAQQIHFASLAEGIDTRTTKGAAFYTVAGVLAAFDRSQKRERANAGLAVGRARGRKGGRPKALTPSEVEAIRTRLQADPNLTVTEICDEYGIARATFYKHVGSVPPDRTPAA
mgnify:CR=1 FL=1